ncbi:hypothetical protein [Streptomyces sp. NPDC058145]
MIGPPQQLRNAGVLIHQLGDASGKLLSWHVAQFEAERPEAGPDSE